MAPHCAFTADRRRERLLTMKGNCLEVVIVMRGDAACLAGTDGASRQKRCPGTREAIKKALGFSPKRLIHLANEWGG